MANAAENMPDREAKATKPLEQMGGEKRVGSAPADNAQAANPSEQRSFEPGTRDKADVQGPAGETDAPER